MAYSPVTWVNGATPAISATNLNHMEGGIEDADNRLTSVEGRLTTVENQVATGGGGGGGSSPTAGTVSGYIPAGTATPTVVHSLGTTDLLWSVHEEATGLHPAVAMATTDVNTVQFTFSTATVTNQYRYTIAAANTALVAPQVRDVPVVQAYASSLTVNAAAGNYRIVTATGNLTLNDPSNGVDGQNLRIRVIASGAQRVVTFAGTLKRPASIASTLTIASGLRGDIGLTYESAYGWTVGMAYVA